MEKNSHRTLSAPGLLDGQWRIYGRQDGYAYCDGVLSLQDCWAAAEHQQFQNVDFSFSARAPEEAGQVQIWASVRHFNRDYRYMIGLRGGSQKQLYVARLGAVGYDRMLALRPLQWLPLPGQWYQIRIVMAGNRLAVYLGGEAQPLVLCEDPDAPFESGCVALGGGFIRTQYRDLSVREISADALDQVQAQPDFLEQTTLPPAQKEALRQRQRAQYRAYGVPILPESRAELSLDGGWLFIPDYEARENPQDPAYNDSGAHVIPVPSSWIPLMAWLEGESMGSLNKGQSDHYHLEELTRCRNQTFDYEKTQSAWYRHHLDLPEGIEQKRVILDFEGIALASAVYCNGILVQENIGMFTPQQIDISDQVHPGRNILAVQVYRCLPEQGSHILEDDSVEYHYAKARETTQTAPPVSECVHQEFRTEDIPHGFYSGHPGGIWRSVRLIICDRISVQDCWFRPTLTDAVIEAAYENTGTSCEDVTLSYQLVHRTTGELLCGGPVETVTLSAGEKRTAVFRTPQVSPRLWSPGKPNLYDLTLTLRSGWKILDSYRERVGFRTVQFEGSTLIYNGKPLWVRGGNHMPAHIHPTDADLAHTFIRTALKHNVIATRTHVAPWGSAWLDAADEAGMMVSLEGTWPWLMISQIPSQRALEIWKRELRQLFHRHRNRPSLFLVTLNNEMNFYLIGGSDETVREKGFLVQGGIRVAREELPDLPLVCDSGYFRGPTTQHGRYQPLSVANGRYERIILPNGFDDGDMDDPHFYFGWYEPSFFHFMNGEFGRDMTLPGRPCMSQECSVGYTRAEDGMIPRSYLFDNQTPQTTTGKRAYEHNDPKYFQHNHAFQIQGLVEMFRRVEHERTCGVLLFAFETWFYFHHDSKRLQPMQSANQLKKAYQPVLASAELFGRHFYGGKTLQTAITLINDSAAGSDLHRPCVVAELTAAGKTLAREVLQSEDVPYFRQARLQLNLPIPSVLPSPRTEAKLVLSVWENDVPISVNDYDLLLATDDWALQTAQTEPIFCLSTDGAARKLLARYGLPAQCCSDLTDLDGQGRRLVICRSLHPDEAEAVRRFAQTGGRVVLLNQRALPEALLAGKSVIYTEEQMEIMTVNVPESSIFCGLGELDTAWFDNGRDVPYVAYGRYTLDRKDDTFCALAETLQWHNYIAKSTEYIRLGGTPLFSMRAGEGAVLVSALRTDVCGRDPVASRLTANLLTWDFDEA